MKYVMGIDIGGTKINSAVIDEKGNIIDKYRIQSNADEGREEVLKRIRISIDRLMVTEVEGIGVATAGFIDSENGIVKFAGNIQGWTGLHLKEELESTIDIPVFVDNDANIAALCEKWLGAARDYRSFVMLTMGTGLGGAIYHEKLGFWEGESFQGAELGHAILYPYGRKCTCGQKGCAEKYIAGSALSLNYKDLTGKELIGPEIISNIETDQNAKESIYRMARDMGIYLSSIKNIFDPQGVVIGGGFIETKEYWWEDMLKVYYEYCNRPEGMEIVPAEYLNDAGVIGAGNLAFDRLGVKDA